MTVSTITYRLWALFFVLQTFGQIFAQGTPDEVNYGADEGGYPSGYTPYAKFGKFDLSSKAANEPFRHFLFLTPNSRAGWEHIVDIRDFGFKALAFDLTRPKEYTYIDINEASFRDPVSMGGRTIAANPVYSPDPKRVQSAQGQVFKGVNGVASTVRIDNVEECAKWNPFLLSDDEVDFRVRAIANPNIGHYRWDIEGFDPTNFVNVQKSRQVWNGGQYRHTINGGTDPKFSVMDDDQFYRFVMDRWSTIFSDLFQKTKDYTQAKVWMYGLGPLTYIDPKSRDQFDTKGNISSDWSTQIQVLWKFKNQKYGKSPGEIVDYLENWDNIPDMYHWAIIAPKTDGTWDHTDLIKLKSSPKTNITPGRPTRYCLTDIGTDNTGNRRVRVSLHAQDGALRLANKPYRVLFEHWKGNAYAEIPAGQYSVDVTTTTSDPTALREYQTAVDEFYLFRIWNTIYCTRRIEPTKLAFLNWEPAPRSSSLAITDVFDQRIYDAMIAFTNLQNFGIVHWESSLAGKNRGMVAESIILSQKKIAPYKNHIENQTLCIADVSMDNGTTWIPGGYPDEPFEQCYNGWWMCDQYKKQLPVPIFNVTYNAQQGTILVAHLGAGIPTAPFSYKIRVRVPNSTKTYIFDLTSTRNLQYAIFKI
jgi:hypothetical protein